MYLIVRTFHYGSDFAARTEDGAEARRLQDEVRETQDFAIDSEGDAYYPEVNIVQVLADGSTTLPEWERI
jgi:ribonuclease D